MRMWTASLAGALLSVVTLSAQSPARAVLPVPDLPGYKTLKADFHLHTVFSDGYVWPTVHLLDAWRDGLDVIAFTDHLEYLPHKDDVKPDANRAYALSRGMAEQLGMILVPGVEITKPDPNTAALRLPDGSAHFNALFVTDANALLSPDLMEALQRAKSQGAFVVWNHPGYRVERAEWFPQIARAHAAGLFQGMEMVNGPDVYEEALPWFAEHHLTMLADTDAHLPVVARAAGGVRPITLLFVKTADLAGVREALDSRRTAAWLGDDVWGAEELLQGLWSGAISIATPQPLLKRKGWGLPIEVRNTSAIPMRCRVVSAPEWLVFTEALDLKAEVATLVRPAFTRDAPAGMQHVTLELEVTNLHVADGRGLRVRLPVTFEIRK